MLYDFLAGDQPNICDIEPAHAIFVFGHSTPFSAEHAGQLFNLKKAPVVLVTGGKKGGGRLPLPQGYFSEADYYAAILDGAGVPKQAILQEERATNTLENVLFGMSRLTVSLPNPPRLILVSLEPHLMRCALTMRRHFPNVSFVCSATRIRRIFLRDPEAVRRLCEEVGRIKEYSAKGDIYPADIPPEVERAYEVLSAAS